VAERHYALPRVEDMLHAEGKTYEQEENDCAGFAQQCAVEDWLAWPVEKRREPEYLGYFLQELENNEAARIKLNWWHRIPIALLWTE